MQLQANLLFDNNLYLNVQELYNPTIWGKESFYDELAKAQKVDMDRREKERKERTKVRRWICNLYGFPCEMDFSHHKFPNLNLVTSDSGVIRRFVVRKIHLTRKTIQNYFRAYFTL